MATYESGTDEQKRDYATYAKPIIGAASSIGAIGIHLGSKFFGG